MGRGQRLVGCRSPHCPWGDRPAGKIISGQRETGNVRSQRTRRPTAQGPIQLWGEDLEAHLVGQRLAAFSSIRWASSSAELSLLVYEFPRVGPGEEKSSWPRVLERQRKGKGVVIESPVSESRVSQSRISQTDLGPDPSPAVYQLCGWRGDTLLPCARVSPPQLPPGAWREVRQMRDACHIVGTHHVVTSWILPSTQAPGGWGTTGHLPPVTPNSEGLDSHSKSPTYLLPSLPPILWSGN